MEVMFQELKVKMYSDKPTAKPATNQVLDFSTEELMSQPILSIKPYSRENMSTMLANNMKPQLKLLEFKDNKTHIRRYE